MELSSIPFQVFELMQQLQFQTDSRLHTKKIGQPMGVHFWVVPVRLYHLVVAISLEGFFCLLLSTPDTCELSNEAKTDFNLARTYNTKKPQANIRFRR